MTIIRHATIKDYEKIAEFSKLIALHHVKNRPDILKKAPELTKREYKKTLKNKNCRVLIAEIDGKPAAYCKTFIKKVGNEHWTDIKLVHVYEMYVDISFRQQGVASSLLDEIKKIANEIGATQIELDVWSFNEAAIKLYQKSGYTPQRIKMELKL